MSLINKEALKEWTGIKQGDDAMIEQKTFADMVTAGRMAELTGLTVRALEHRRQRGLHPEFLVWEKIHGRIMYSISGYNEWSEQQRSPLALRSGVKESGYASHGMAGDTGSHTRSRPRRRTSSAPAAFRVR